MSLKRGRNHNMNAKEAGECIPILVMPKLDIRSVKVITNIKNLTQI
jgi:hypothetical protein